MMPTSRDLPADRLAIGQLLVRLLRAFRAELFEPAAGHGYPDLREPHLHIFGSVGVDGIRLTDLAARAQLSLATTSELVSDLHRLGYLEEGHLVHAMRNDLVGQYIGQTAPRTRRMLDRAMGGVLFIDEAYYLYRASDPQDFGQEAIDILLQVMENDRDKLVVILAGYHGRMEEFFESNPGMRSRIAHHIDFATYELDELVAIGRGMLQESRYYLSAEAETTLREYLTRQMQQPEFANARSVRNEMERARLRHAHRLATDLHRGWNRDDLMRIEPMDIWASDMLSLSAPGRAAGQRGNE